MRRAILLATAALLASTPALAQEQAPPANPLIDYAGFAALVQKLGPVREARRLAWDRFAEGAQTKGALLLDARSAADFARGHIAGAVNLPFPEFNDESLRQVIGDNPDRPIYIYCNNNFADNAAPVVTKRVQLALNIPTFVNLVGYGYGNVWELAEVVRMDDPRLGWTSGA